MIFHSKEIERYTGEHFKNPLMLKDKTIKLNIIKKILRYKHGI